VVTYWLLGTIVLLASALAWLLRELIRVRREQTDLKSQIDELAQPFKLQAQSINAHSACAIGVDRRLQQLEAQSAQLVERQVSIQNRQTTMDSRQADERPYDRAIRMVKDGAGVRRLVEELELSESEANLIARMHGDSHDLKSVEI